MPVLDFHAHVLPGMDDGSPDAETSLAMLSEMKRQGTEAVVATPHFYGDREYPDAFLARRGAAEAVLTPLLRSDRVPTVYVGAEVAYFPGIGETRELEKLCIRGTRFVLMEMPFCRWDSIMVDDVISVREKLGLFPILAHVERYPAFFRSAAMERLAENHVLFQCNASFFVMRSTRRRALFLFTHSNVHLLGSDAHDMGVRRPELGDAASFLRERAGETALARVRATGERVLSGAKPLWNFSE